MKITLFITLVFISAAQLTALTAQCNNLRDYQGLRALYLSSDGDNWNNNTNWPSENYFVNNPAPNPVPELFGWYGLDFCQFGRIREIRLNNNDLVGTIPDEIARLDSLRTLILHTNELNGNIPIELGSLRLSNLNLRTNQLSGNIPIELGNIPTLGTLYLNGNNLSGPIPTELGNLTTLSVLELQLNFLSGSIPPELGDLTNLIRLQLSGNNLIGQIPTSFNQLSNLVLFGVSTNNLSGCYDPVLKEPPSVLCNFGDPSVSLGNNFLDTWNNFCTQDGGSCNCVHPDFEALEIFYTNTSGPQWTTNTDWLSNCDPCSWFGITCNGNGRVTGIDLQVNNLVGILPQELGQLEFLIQLKLGVNTLGGNIPSQLGGLLNLQNIWLHNNEYNSALPLFTNQNNPTNVFPSLDRLYLYNNNFSGAIPPSYADLSSLSVLRTFNNPLLSGCYDVNLFSLCDQLINNAVGDIHNGTGFSSWEDFCLCNANVCSCNEINQWIGGVSNWDDPANWSLSHEPLACEIVEINTTGDIVTMPVNYSSTVYLIDVAEDCQLEIPLTSRLHVLADSGFSNWTNCN